MRVLQDEPACIVTLDDDGTVRKTFRPMPGDDPEERAVREHELLRLLSDRLFDGPARVPVPLELVVGAETYVRMTVAPGRALRRSLLDGTPVDGVAEAIALALRAFVEAVGEPWWDLHLRNMHHDPHTGVVTLYDFGVPDVWRHRRAGTTPPVELSLANLVGSTVFEAARPRALRERRAHTRGAALVHDVVRLFPGADRAWIEREALAVFGRWARRTPTRRGWYAARGLLAPPRRAVRGCVGC